MTISQGREMASCQAHNLEIAGSIPVPATIWRNLLVAAKEALAELEPTISDSPGYYADEHQVERLRSAIVAVEAVA